MKKQVLLLTLFTFLSFYSFGQAQRRVMVEEATNASCGPCASQNPAFDALLAQNANMVTVIKYHGWWPGYDPMYEHNIDENTARINYYAINSVPRAIVDGQYDGQPMGVTQSLLNSYANVQSPFEEIAIYHYLSPNLDSIYVFMRIQAAQDYSENFLRGMCAVVEKHIHYNNAPGSNGEKDFFDVMKKMLPNSAGTQLQSSWNDGEYKIIAQVWELENVFDTEQLSVIGFVQNSNSKIVRQSGVSSSEPFAPLFAIDAAPAGILNLTSTTCLDKVSPVLSIANYGSQNLASANIHYSINGGEEQVMSWTGNVEYLKLKNIPLPDIEFDLLEDNELKVYLSDVNGSGDEYPSNDTIRFNFGRSISVMDNISLMIKLDGSPEETTWEVINSAGEVVFEGGPYSTPNGFVSQTLNFQVSDCYKFTIYDAGNNGINLPGFFTLFKGSTQILTGSAFGSEASQMFSGDLTVGTSEIEFDANLTIYPNPLANEGVVDFVLFHNSDVKINLLNQMGQHVKQIVDGNLNAGTHNLKFRTADLSQGIYFMEVVIGNKKEIKKISVVK